MKRLLSAVLALALTACAPRPVPSAPPSRPLPAASAYSPAPWFPESFRKAVPRFAPHRMGAWFVGLTALKNDPDFFSSPFWKGDEISPVPFGEPIFPLDRQVEEILAVDPHARFIVRFGLYEPAGWRKLHPEELFVDEAGKRHDIPSLASELWADRAAAFAEAVIRHCEQRPWADRIVGYADFLRVEGSHEPLFQGRLFDHGPRMTARWREWLRKKYGSEDELRKAHRDPKATFDAVAVPRTRPGGPYWQADNAPLRDYLLLSQELFHRHFREVCARSRRAAGPDRMLLVDALKQPMAGWSHQGFFDAKASWSATFPDLLAGSGHLGVAELFSAPGFDGLITPHDYHARGAGGVFEPEGAADSAILRGKRFFCEMDVRTWLGDGDYGQARNEAEAVAVLWRNVATAITRGFTPYYMDLSSDWFSSDALHREIGRQVKVLDEASARPLSTPPGIAMILDDRALLVTNGNGQVLHEHVLWETKTGLARCGVPFRTYLIEDLALENFPDHRVFYFPNLYRADDAVLDLLRRKVFRDGHVVVWGPGSGISDGRRLGPASAELLTGFRFEWMPVDHPRRTLIADFDHPITRGLPADLVIGSPTAYGPLLFPKDGRSLGHAWTKMGKTASGLAVKELDGWTSVFTTAAPLPAALWRNLARAAGAHVYSEENDVLLAGNGVVAVHSLKSGPRRIRLPGRYRVTDLAAGGVVSASTDEIRFELKAPETRVFGLGTE